MTSEQTTLLACAYLSDIRIWPPELKTSSRRWLKNFKEDELEFAVALLDSFVLISDEIVDRMFVAGFDSLAATITEQENGYSAKRNRWATFRENVLVTHPTGEMPNVTDSGYAFDRKARQKLGIDQAHILEPAAVVRLLAQGPSRPVLFVDDFVGSGDQFIKTWNRTYETSSGEVSFASLTASGHVSGSFYTPLICTDLGQERITQSCEGLTLSPSHILPRYYSARSPDSLLWPDHLIGGANDFVTNASLRAGIPAGRRWGYQHLGLAIAFEHGIPDATLPLFYWEENGWTPLVRLR